MTVQNPEDLKICRRCGGKNFMEFTQKDNVYQHFRCVQCYLEITVFNDEDRNNADD
jgi:hypothetical protein